MLPGPGNYVQFVHIWTRQYVHRNVPSHNAKTQTWDGPWPPPIYLGGVTLYTIFTWGNSGTGCPTGLLFSVAHPAPPLHLAHTIGGSCLNCPWPTGTHILISKRIKTVTRAWATQWLILHLRSCTTLQYNPRVQVCTRQSTTINGQIDLTSIPYGQSRDLHKNKSR